MHRIILVTRKSSSLLVWWVPMKPYLLVFLLVFFQTSLQSASQRTVSETELSEKLKLYQKIKTLKTNFHQTKHVKDLDLDLQSEGSLVLIRPERVVWKIKKPSPTELILENRKIEMTSGEGSNKKTQNFSLDGAMDPAITKSLLSMIAWLKLDLAAIRDAYTIYGLEKDTYQCVPKDEKGSVFKSLTLSLHSKGHMQKLLIEEKSGDHIEIAFDEPKITLN